MNPTDSIRMTSQQYDAECSILYHIRGAVKREFLRSVGKNSKNLSNTVSMGTGEQDKLVRDSGYKSIRSLDGWGVYGGKEFPIEPFGGVKLIPRWKDLSYWMKAQVGCMAIALDQAATAKPRFISFNHHLNASLLKRFQDQPGNKSLGDMVRNEFGRQCRNHFGRPLSFYFVIEEWDRSGTKHVDPHIHGLIEIPALKIPVTLHGNSRNALKRIELRKELYEAERVYGLRMLKEASLRVIGAKFRRPPKGWVAQNRQSNFVRPFGSIHQGVSYAFKNADKEGKELDKQRLYNNRVFQQNARELWSHISGKTG